VSVLAGSLILRWPGVTADRVLLVFGIWTLVTGRGELVAAFAGHAEMEHAGLYAVVGVALVLIGVAMFVRPTASLATLANLVVEFTVISASVDVVIAFGARNLARQSESEGTGDMPPGAAPAAWWHNEHVRDQALVVAWCVSAEPKPEFRACGRYGRRAAGVEAWRLLRWGASDAAVYERRLRRHDTLGFTWILVT
jgi:hypothetical protein